MFDLHPVVAHVTDWLCMQNSFPCQWQKLLFYCAADREVPRPVCDAETTVGEDRAATAPCTGEDGPGCVKGMHVGCMHVGCMLARGHLLSLIPRSAVSVSVTHTGVTYIQLMMKAVN